MTVRVLQRVLAFVAAVWDALVSDTFTGTNGTAPNARWSVVPVTDANGNPTNKYPTGGTVTIQSNAMRISTNSTAAWTAAASVFLGNPNQPWSAPAIYPDADYSFDYTLLNLSQQYPTIGVRARNAELWNGGDGGNTPQTGYALVIAPMEKTIDIIQCYNSTSIIASPISVPGMTVAAMKWRILVYGKRLAFKVWFSGSEPGGVGSDTNWTYDNKNLLQDQSDGSIVFSVANGPASEAKTVTIDNFVSTVRPLGGFSGAQPAPTAAVSGFTQQYVENFDTAAPSGTGTSSFLNVYSNTVQPYDEASPAYQQRALLSAHDGVLDVAMNGTQGAAFVFGSPTNANSWVGGRFSMRAKAIGAWGNGPAVMIWPARTADGPWSDGEIDFPESVSGSDDPTKGFQDSPWIHHHRMNQDMNLAQDVNLGVSWRDWHEYACEWYPPGKGPNTSTGTVIYYVDGVEVYRTTQDVPNTVHRYMVQVGYWGAPGNMYIDWARIDSVN